MPPSPAAARPHPQPNPGANREIAGQGKSAYLAEAVIAREAAKVDAALNLGLGGFRLRKLVRRFVREGRTDIDFYTPGSSPTPTRPARPQCGTRCVAAGVAPMPDTEVRPGGETGAQSECGGGNGLDVNHIPPGADETAQAKRLTERIRLRLVTIVDNLEAVGPMVEQAKAGGVHLLLGYKSWTAYVAAEFGEHLTRLAKLDRGPVVELLAGEGMSARAIAKTIGVSASTVDRLVRHRDAPDGGEPSAGTALVRVSDALGVERPPSTMTRSWKVDGIREAEEQRLRSVVGIDGKSYSRPAAPPAAKPRRRPPPEAYRDHAWKVRANVESLARLHQDDRFTANREAVVHGSAAALAMAANHALDLLDDLGVDRLQYDGGAR